MAVVREVSRPTLVLGSTQPTELVGRDAMRERGVELARRRGGGGAVYLEPGDQLWVDAWIPRDDPLWLLDVSVAAEWVGAWWMTALAALGQHGFDVHTGRSVPGELGELVCFAGRGPGEVFHGARKVVGLSQWRAREGALFSSCAYLHWDPAPLLGAGARATITCVPCWRATWRRWRWAWPSSIRRSPTWGACGTSCWARSPSFATTPPPDGDSGRRLGAPSAAFATPFSFPPLPPSLPLFSGAPASSARERRLRTVCTGPAAMRRIRRGPPGAVGAARRGGHPRAVVRPGPDAPGGRWGGRGLHLCCKGLEVVVKWREMA